MAHPMSWGRERDATPPQDLEGKPIQEIADLIYGQFNKMRREGQDHDIWITKDGTPQWMTNIFHKAHGDMLPDDWKYEFIVEALAYLSEGNDPDEYHPEPDIYYHELNSWFASHLERAGYVDEAVREYGHSDQGVSGDIGYGQMFEKEEVYHSILQSLREIAGE